MSASAVGTLLQEWRQRRHLSQLALATHAGVSTRHLCFVETGRARPSREMVLLLADALDVPLRERNAFLLAAGFAPVYDEADLEGPELAPIRTAIDAMLAHHEPYPAAVLSRHWDVLRMNEGARRFFGFLLPSLATMKGPLNILRLHFDPDGFRPFVVGWEAFSSELLHRVQREMLGRGDDARVKALHAELVALRARPLREGANGAAARAATPTAERRSDPFRPLLPVVPIVYERDGMRFDYFATVTTIGTPQDVTLQEMRLECLFPLDAATRANAQRIAGAGATRT